MQQGLFSILTDLEKSAASVDELATGAKRLGILKVPPNKNAIGTSHTSYYSPPPKKLSLMTGYPAAAYPKTNLDNKVVSPGGVGGSSQALRKKVEAVEKTITEPGVVALDHNARETLRNLSGPGHRAINTVTGLHEGFERAVKPHEIAPIASHISPKVLLDEHNMLSKMTGPGSDEARTIFRDIRNNDQEYDHIKNTMRQMYGDRSLKYLEEGNKIPSAMKRNLVGRYNAIHRWNIEPIASRFGTKLAAVQSQPQHEEFLDHHFSLSPQWKTFKNKLRAKSFVEAVRQDTRADDKLKRYSEANAMHSQARGVPSFSVPSMSSGKKYTVKYHAGPDRFSCNCGDWVHARSHQTSKSTQDCKHIQSVKSQLQASGKTPEDMVKMAAFGMAASKMLSELNKASPQGGLPV